VKKPVYKRPWLWILVVAVIGIGIAAASSGGGEDAPPADRPVAEEPGGATGAAAPDAEEPEPEPGPDPQNLPVGTAYEVQDGLTVSVEAVEAGWYDYEDKPAIQVTVSYTNGSDREHSFNPFDWQAQTVSGVRDSTAFMVEGATDEMSSGNLAPGGSFTKHLYFLEEDGIAKLLYGNSIFSSEQDYVAWSVGQ
jgi:hypothetical protein